MARGTTLEKVVDMVRDEAGQTSNAAFGQATAEPIRSKIRRTYRRLHADWNWPHLRITRDETLSAGSRYYSFDADLDPDRLYEAWTREEGMDRWKRVKYGIGPDMYNAHDPTQNERKDPVCYWDYYEGDQYEVWPLPLTNSTLRFIGHKKAKNIVADGDTLDLDDNLIALYVAAEILLRSKSGDAQAKLEQAAAHYHRLKGNSQRSGVFPIQRQPRRFLGVQVRAPGT